MLKRLFDKTFCKFILVGFLNTLVGAGTMFIMYNFLNCSYWVSSASNYVIGSIVSYYLNKYFTFKNSEKRFSQLLLFVTNISLCYIIAYGMAKPFIRIFTAAFSVKTQENLAMLAGMGIFVILNYLGQRLFVFGSYSQLIHEADTYDK